MKAEKLIKHQGFGDIHSKERPINIEIANVVYLMESYASIKCKELEEENKAYTNNQYPIRAKDLKGNEEDFSVDVITLSEQNMLNIGYWNYDMKKWLFHTDTLSDPYEGGELENFIWMYKPKYLK